MKVLKYSSVAGNGNRTNNADPGKPVKLTKTGVPRCSPRNTAREKRIAEGLSTLAGVWKL